MGAGAGGAEDEDYTPLVPQVRVRVLVECNTAEQFVAEYHRFVDGDRIFIATEVTEAVGNLVQFRIDLGDGRAVLHGTGTVLQVRPPHDGLPRGMVLQFIALDERSAHIVELMAQKRARATPADGVLSMDAPPAGSDELAPPHVATPVPDESPALDSQSETRSYSRLTAPRTSVRVEWTAPFRLAEGAPDARRTWRTRSVERPRVLPANPFCDVPDGALAYFVDWAIERNGTSSSPRAGRAVAYAEVRMQAPRRLRRRPPTWVPFVVGLGIGGIAILSAFDLWRDVAAMGRPRVVTREVMLFPPVVANDETRDAKRAHTHEPARVKKPPVALASAAPSGLAASSAAAPSAAAPSAAAPSAAAPSAAAPSATPPPVAAPSLPPSSLGPPVAAPAAAAGRTSSRAAELVPLTITAEPGAQVLLDGQRVGRTPLSLNVPRGAHAVELLRPRYQTAHLDVEAPGRAAGHLERPRATLHVTSNVADAEVFVDGESVGRAPTSAEVAGFERYAIEVRAGQRTWKKKLYVKPPLSDLSATFPAD